ncbi:hypothetical protein K438DRAFT_1769154 [Mycena galopus ATCC 62051]|nr:hypothetical protein K438DRAFT_1769154 [Mycena galopus ATCC 62051]
MLTADGVRIMLFFLVLLHQVIAQTTHTVTVGVEGSFYSPPTVSAGLNDTVMFVFGGDEHTVTQSAFDAPCVRLDGGFDSGFNGRGANFSGPTPVWTLRITNISETIWFFCQASIPTSHCESGMVGAINPPSIAMYDAFVSAAKAVTSTPAPSPTFIASGQGAFATNSPMASSISLDSDSFILSSTSSTPTTSSLSSATSTAPAASGGSGSHLTVIAGCTTAGGIVILILIALTVFHCRRWRTYRQTVFPSPSKGMYQDPRDKPPGLESTDISTTAATHVFPTVGNPSPAVLLHRSDDTDTSTNASSGFPYHQADVRPLPRAPSRNKLGQANADVEVAAAPPSPPVDINTLAREVLNVLFETPPRPGARQQPDSSPNDLGRSNPNHSPRRGDESGWYESGASVDEAHRVRGSPAPPHYRN